MQYNTGSPILKENFALKELKRNKSSGIDNLYVERLKTLDRWLWKGFSVSNNKKSIQYWDNSKRFREMHYNTVKPPCTR